MTALAAILIGAGLLLATPLLAIACRHAAGVSRVIYGLTFLLAALMCAVATAALLMPGTFASMLTLPDRKSVV